MRHLRPTGEVTCFSLLHEEMVGPGCEQGQPIGGAQSEWKIRKTASPKRHPLPDGRPPSNCDPPPPPPPARICTWMGVGERFPSLACLWPSEHAPALSASTPNSCWNPCQGQKVTTEPGLWWRLCGRGVGGRSGTSHPREPRLRAPNPQAHAPLSQLTSLTRRTAR